MKYIYLFFILSIPFNSFSQNRKEIRSIIENKKDSIKICINKIIELEKELDYNYKITKLLQIENQHLKKEIDSLKTHDTILTCALELKSYKDTITDRWGDPQIREANLMFYNCKPFTGIAVSLFKNGKIDKALNFSLGKIHSFQEFYHSGKIYKQGNYDYGPDFSWGTSGYWYTWHENGQLSKKEKPNIAYSNGSGYPYVVQCHAFDAPEDIIPDDCCLWCWDKNGNKIKCKEYIIKSYQGNLPNILYDIYIH